jgi:hypothetical protein
VASGDSVKLKYFAVASASTFLILFNVCMTFMHRDSAVSDPAVQSLIYSAILSNVFRIVAEISIMTQAVLFNSNDASRQNLVRQ